MNQKKPAYRKKPRLQKKQSNQRYQKGKQNQATEDPQGKFVTLNISNTNLIRDYINSVAPNLFTIISNTNAYIFYLLFQKEPEIYLVPKKQHLIIKRLNNAYPIEHAGIYFGKILKKNTHRGTQKFFRLSYEGGEFLLNAVRHVPKILKNVDIIQVNSFGERKFLYGQDIDEMRHIISDNITDLVKRKLIFVENRFEEYIGLALLKVKQAGSMYQDRSKKEDMQDFSNSINFQLGIMNLTDSGYYLRRGG